MKELTNASLNEDELFQVVGGAAGKGNGEVRTKKMECPNCGIGNFILTHGGMAHCPTCSYSTEE